MVLPKPSVRDLNRTAVPDRSREHLLRLDRNELVPEWRSDVFDGIMARLSPASLSAYPAVSPLYERLAKALGVDPAQLLLGAGSDWIIRACFDTYCKPGDRVVLPFPTYGMYPVYARLSDAEIQLIPYRLDFAFPTAEVLDALREPVQILGIASPNGTLGSAIDRADLRVLLTAARERDTLVILDEAYLEYTDDHSSALVADYDNVVVVRTFSKAGGLAGLRVGYALAQSEVIRWLSRVRPNVEINQVAVVAAGYLLDHPEVVQQHVRETLAGKQLLVERLRAAGLPVFPGAANFVQVQLGAARHRILDAMRDNDVLVKDQEGDSLLDRWTRITVGPATEMTRVATIIEAEVIDG